MSLVRLLGYRTLVCGCITGHYRELATCRELTYIEEKGGHCGLTIHRRNHTLNRSKVPAAPAASITTHAP